MSDTVLKLILLHLAKGAVSGPPVVGDAINRSHLPRPVPSRVTMNIDRKIIRIGNDLKELIYVFLVRPGLVGEVDPEELHASGLNFLLLSRVSGAFKINHCLDSQRRQVVIIGAYRLGASVIVGAYAAEVLNSDVCSSRQRRGS